METEKDAYLNNPMIDENVKYWMALKSIEGVGNALFEALLDRFGSPAAVFDADRRALAAVAGCGAKIADAIVSFRDEDGILRRLEALERMGASVITIADEAYPSLLRNIFDRPVLLYVKGQLKKDDIPVAIVGSRHASAYGRYATDKISRALALKGVAVTSGMARGIDACAHRGALAARGRTLAVLGSGLDVVYPPENEKLFSEITEQGAVLTEYPPHTQPLPHHFPSRNRIISGLSYGVVVVEAGEKSGSLITARLAMEQGREVFAIPGPIDAASSRGAHHLIRQGAKLIENADDIVEEILPQVPVPVTVTSPASPDEAEAGTPKQSLGAPAELRSGGNQAPLAEREKTVLALVSHDKIHADDLIAGSGMSAADVLSVLIHLELKGFVVQHPGKYFSLTK
jgi:DNA processing protein